MTRRGIKPLLKVNRKTSRGLSIFGGPCLFIEKHSEFGSPERGRGGTSRNLCVETYGLSQLFRSVAGSRTMPQCDDECQTEQGKLRQGRKG